MRLGRFDDAVKARRNALRLLGASAEREADLGEALVSLANGVVTADAKARCDHALKLDLKDVTARFYSGLAAEQDNRPEDAARIWRELAADAPEGAGWLASVQRGFARLEAPRAGRAAAATRRHDPRHGRAARSAPAPGRLRRRRLDTARALLHGAGRGRQGA